MDYNKMLKNIAGAMGFKSDKFEDEMPADVIDIKGEDGKTYRVSAIEVDGTVEEITEDGTLEAVTTLDIVIKEDGRTLVVVDGIITEIKDKVEEDLPEGETNIELSKKKLFSKVERSNFAIITETTIWETETTNTSFEIGEKVTATYVDFDGAIIEFTVADGEYTLEDGTKIFVDTMGIIVMRILTDGTIETIEVAPASDAIPAPESTDTAMAKMEAGFEKVIEQVTIALASITKENNELKEELNVLRTAVNTFAKTPVADKTKVTQSFKSMSIDDRLKELSKR